MKLYVSLDTGFSVFLSKELHVTSTRSPLVRTGHVAPPTLKEQGVLILGVIRSIGELNITDVVIQVVSCLFAWRRALCWVSAMLQYSLFKPYSDFPVVQKVAWLPFTKGVVDQ